MQLRYEGKLRPWKWLLIHQHLYTKKKSSVVTQHTDLVRTHEMITAARHRETTLHISWLLVFWPLEQ